MKTKDKVSAAAKRATAKYEKKAYFKTLVRFPAELESRIRDAAGGSLNGFIVNAVISMIDKIENEENDS